MSDRAAFISAILDDLADDTARLVFADWLQENGEEARAEFIRVQIEAAKRKAAPLHRGHPALRVAELLRTHEAQWRKAVGEKFGTYERGFLTGVPFYTTSFAHAAELLAREPVAGVLHLWGTYPDDVPVTLDGVDELAADPFLRAVTGLRSEGEFGAERFVRLMRSPYLRNLRTIDLFDDVIGFEGVRAIVDSPAPFALERLDLNSALQFDDMIAESDATFAAVELIATAPRFAALRRLGLTFNALDDRSIRALLASTTLPRNLQLDLDGNDYDEEGFAEALAERFASGSDGG